MHVQELVELAALLARQGPALVRGNAQLSAAGMNQYWSASKCRLDRWTRALREAAKRSAEAHERPRVPIRAVMEEVLASEVLTRVWTAVVTAHSRRHGFQDGELVARSIYTSHLEIRLRTLRLLFDAYGMPIEEAVLVNRLRRRAEHWIDLLIGALAPTDDVSEFSVNPRRAREFADEASRNDTHVAWSLQLASLKLAFQQGCTVGSPNYDLNATIAAGILGCFDPDAFNAVGLLRSTWLLRLVQAADDTECLIADFLAEPRRADGDHALPAPQANDRFTRRLSP